MRRTLPAAAFVAALLMAAPAPAASETPPPESLFSPRVVEIPDTTSQVTLKDMLGNSIPLTGRGVETLENSTLIYPPRLPPGVYTILWDGGQQQLNVDGAGFRLEDTLEGAADSRTGPVLAAGAVGSVAVASGLLAGFLLVRRGRRGAGTLAAVAAVAAAGALLAAPADQEDLDPCIAAGGIVEHQQCSFSHLYRTVTGQGVEEAVDELMRLAGPEGDERWRLQCHETAHMIGEIGWKLEQDLERMVAAGDPDCQFGYFHGMLEAMGAYLDDNTFPSSVIQACSLVRENFGGNFTITGGCAHGVGHAAMWRYGADYTQAREVCAGFDEEMERDECVSGAVMEWVASRDRARSMGSERDLPSPGVQNPFELCAEPYGELTPGCASGAALGVSPEQLDDAASLCAAATAEVGLSCLNFLMRTILDTTPFDMEERAEGVTELCEKHPWDIPSGRCYAYLGYERFLSTMSRERAEELCGLLKDESAANGCREGIGDGERYQQELTGR